MKRALGSGLLVALALAGWLAHALDVTLADLVVEDTDRERLFVELRSARPALIRELRDRAKVAKPAGRA